MKVYPRRVVCGSTGANGDYGASFFSLLKVLAHWDNLRILTEVKSSNLIRHINVRQSRAVPHCLTAHQNVYKFVVPPLATGTFCNTAASAEGAGNTVTSSSE